MVFVNLQRDTIKPQENIMVCVSVDGYLRKFMTGPSRISQLKWTLLYDKKKKKLPLHDDNKKMKILLQQKKKKKLLNNFKYHSTQKLH